MTHEGVTYNPAMTQTETQPVYREHDLVSYHQSDLYTIDQRHKSTTRDMYCWPTAIPGNRHTHAVCLRVTKCACVFVCVSVALSLCVCACV